MLIKLTWTEEELAERMTKSLRLSRQWKAEHEELKVNKNSPI